MQSQKDLGINCMTTKLELTSLIEKDHPQQTFNTLITKIKISICERKVLQMPKKSYLVCVI